MATFSSVTRQHVLQAIDEHDTRGPEEFLALYGFGPTPGTSLSHEGRAYDARALLGVAHRYATGRLATPEEVHNGMPEALTILRRRGFQVTGPTTTRGGTRGTGTSARAAGRTSSRAPARRSAPARDVAPAICPTCSMTLPATGICDDCA